MQSKEKKMLKALERHKEFYDEKTGISLMNDFLQMSKILQELHETGNTKAFNAMYALIEKSLNDDIMIKERGKRISGLQQGQHQPKGTGHKNLNGLKKEIAIKTERGKK